MHDRRRFLAGLAGAITLPALARRARAQTRPAARRLVLFFTPNGTIHRHLGTTGDARSLAFRPGSILEPLSAIARDLVVVEGLEFVGASNHEGGMATMWTGSGAGPTGGASLDQVVAQAIGGATPHRSLELGVHTSAWGGSVQTRMSYRRAGEMLPPDDRPAEVYRRLFGATAAPSEVDRALRLRRSVLDVARAELGEWSRRVPAAEKKKLDVHLEALRETEDSLARAAERPASVCEAPSAPEGSAADPTRFPAVGRAQIDLLVSALACDLTRVASIQWSHTVSPIVMSWLGHSESHHALSHADDGNAALVAAFVAAERWFAEQFATLVSRLASLPEPGGEGRMLDHTLVVWGKEMGDGRLHDCVDVPFVLAGGGLGTGRVLRAPKTSHNQLLLAITRAMGVELPAFGDPALGGTALPGLLG